MLKSIKDSIYWKNEIEVTQEYLAQLVHGDLAGVKSTKSSDDTITLQDIDKEISKCKTYIAYCQEELKKALEIEQGQETKSKSILYFSREYGY